ncbi:methyl-accepting chemotaxis protein, partial [Candidatus Magnetomorum sp. HK-1]
MIQRIKNLSLKTKLVVAFLIVGILPLSVGEYLCLKNAEEALKEQVFMQLSGVREIKKAQIQKFFNERKTNLNVLVQSIETLKDDAYNRLETIQKLKKNRLESWFKTFQSTVHLLKDNPFSALAVYKFHQAFLKDGKKIGGANWIQVEKEFSAVFQDIKQDFNFYDIYLINPSGDIVYSVEKKSDLGKNLITGPLKNSGLAQVFQKVKTSEIAISNFQPYEPSGNKYNAFIAGPIYDNNKNFLGVVGVQTPVKNINEITQDRSGMGKTGESFLVAQVDGKISLCSDRIVKKGQIGDFFPHDFAKKALNGKTGWTYQKDDSGTLEMILYEPLEMLHLNWAIITVESIEENIAHKKEGQAKDYCQKFIESYDYFDLFLIEPNGFVFYSATKKADYHTNMVHGKLANSGLGKLTRKVLQSKKFGFGDFEPYAPNNGEPSAFIAQPIIHKGSVDMIVALQFSLDAINGIMQQREGLGKTSETYLVGPDKLMRSDSFLDPTHHSVKASFENQSKGKVDTEASRASLSGISDHKISVDYNGHPVLSAFCPLNVFGVNWVLIAEIDCVEAFAAVSLMKKIISVILLVSIVAIFLISLFIAKGLSSPVQKIVHFIEKVRSGDKKTTLKMDSKDEIGEMGGALNEMVASQRSLLHNLDNLPTPVMEIDKDYNVKYLNNAGLNLLGLSLKDVVDRKCYSFFKTNHCQTNDCACHRAMATQQTCTGDTVADPEGLNLPIRYTGFPIKDDKGDVTGAIEFVLNVSGERDINNAIVEIIKSINNGDFSKRGDSEVFTGNYRELVMNVNNIVEAFVTPLRLIQ